MFTGIQLTMQILEREQPDKIITIDGNCVVSQVSFDYLHQCRDDTRPDVSLPQNGYLPFYEYALHKALKKYRYFSPHF